MVIKTNVSKSSLTKLYQKLHKWPGLIISVLLLYYSVTGVFMNHRELFSGVDVARTILPTNFQYKNWNNGALKGNLVISPDSILVFGNIGVWLTDSTFADYKSFNSGFPKGMDNRKIFDIHQSEDGSLYAATHFGLFAYDGKQQQWVKFPLELDIKRFVAIESVGDTIFALNRSYLFRGKSNGRHTTFEKIELKEPLDYKKKVSLFETIWQIHSGEIGGLPGKLFVDLLGVFTFFLSLSGIVYFFFPKWIRRRKKKSKKSASIIKINNWSLKWHNYIGAWTFLLLIVLFFTGMFLRPPLLITIVSTKVAPLKYSHLDQPNPWYDKLRDFLYQAEENQFLLSTSKGMYQFTTNDFQPMPCSVQPPVSVMGINTLEPFDQGGYIVGSFSGLFLWHPSYAQIYNYAEGKRYSGQASGRPVGAFKVTGLLADLEKNQYLVDYDQGIIPLFHNRVFPPMPENVLEESKMSLWNLSLEIHTGRFFQPFMGSLYILLVPLSGLVSTLVVLSGYLLWRKRYRRKKKR